MTLDEAKRRSEELKSLIDKTTDTTKLSRYVSELESIQSALGDTITKTNEWKSAYAAATVKINANISETDNLFNKLFDDFKDGFDDVRTKFNEFMQTSTSLGTNINFWREYGQRVRQVGIEYGISIKDLSAFRDANIDIERTFVETGGSAQDYRLGLESFYNTTERLTQITPEFGKSLGNISKVLGITTSDTGKFLGSMNNLNVGFNQSVKILEDLRYSAEKSALNTGKVLRTFTENFEKLNTYSFKNGVQGMIDMVKQSYALKVNMDAVLKLSDDFTDPEKTMEFASNMQLLGGSFSQLGDFNQLMYDAAVAPEELAKNIAKATASLGSFDRETGKFTLSFADRLQLKEASKAMGMSIEDMNKMASTAAKVSDIKMALNFKELTEDQYQILGAMARFEGGEYKIDVGGETKSVATLSGEDIQKIAAEKEKTTLEEQRVAKMDVGELMVAKLEAGKYGTLDFFKLMGADNEEFRKSALSGMGTIGDALHDGLKKNLFKPLENLVSDGVGGRARKVLDNMNLGLIDLIATIKGGGEILLKMLPEDVQKKYESYKKGESEKKREGDLLSTNKFDFGTILKGPSHENGGIPFTVGGKPGFEAEGGEILLTKGVSEDPVLLSLASKLNEIGGGKKFFEYGDVIEKNNYNNYGNVINNSLNSLMKSDFINRVSRVEEINELTNNFKNTMNNATFTNTTQGGLIDKRGDIGGGTIGVNGSVTVDGKVSFEPIKITIEGTTATKEVMVNQEMQNKILNTIEDKIKNMNLYNLTYQSKGSGGINDGKRISTVDFA